MISAVKPGAGRPDLFEPYVYRGTGVDTLTPWMGSAEDILAAAPPPGDCWCDGSVRGYDAHRKRGEEPCDASRADNNLREANRMARKKAAAAGEAPPRSRPLAPHGTTAAYQRHRRHGEKPCPACAEAESRDRTARRRTRKGQS